MSTAVKTKQPPPEEATIPPARKVMADPAHVIVNEAGQAWRTLLIRMPAGSVSDDLRDPGFWRKVQMNGAQALVKMDSLTIIGYDESWYARCIVVHATDKEAKLAIEKIGTFHEIADRLFMDDLYAVHWAGYGFIVKRRKDDVTVSGDKSYPTEQRAISFLQSLYPTKVTHNA